MTTLPETLAPEVHAFVEREGLRDTLRLAVRLVQDHFPEVCRIDADLVEDPESDDAWIALTVQVTGPLDELLERDGAFVNQWIAEAPWPARDKIVVAPWPV